MGSGHDATSLLTLLVSAALARPERIRGRFALRCGPAVTYLVDGAAGDEPPERIDATVEAPLSVLAELVAGGSPVAAWASGRLRLRGSFLKAWELLGAFRR
jgi:hypothetical protein